jgi:hypothetical protein
MDCEPSPCRPLSGLLLILVLIVTFGAPGFLAAQAPVALPQVEGPIPVTDDSYPMMASNRLLDPTDLARLGYVEEEFFVSGNANVYDWNNDGSLSVRSSDGPYTTRILLRRPASSEQFSGNVIMELGNTSRRYDSGFVWSLSWEHLIREGDAWVAITFSPTVVDALQQFNPDRYAALSFANPDPGEPCTPGGPLSGSEAGLRWDAISQIGALLKSGSPDGPMAGFDVEYLYAASHQTDLQTYVNAVHSTARLDEGGPVYDGYILHRDRAPARMNRCGSVPEAGQTMGPVDVPVIRIVAEGDVPTTASGRQPDSDEPDSRYRLFEVAGAPHADAYFYRHMPTLDDQVAVGTDPFMAQWPFGYSCESQITLTESPMMRYIANAAFEHLDRWVRNQEPPPRAEPIAIDSTDAGVVVVRDEFGNAVGGARTPQLLVPSATYDPKSDGPGACRNLLHTEEFDWARLESVHGSYSEYADALNEAAGRLERDRWLVPEDGAQIRAELAQ